MVLLGEGYVNTLKDYHSIQFLKKSEKINISSYNLKYKEQYEQHRLSNFSKESGSNGISGKTEYTNNTSSEFKKISNFKSESESRKTDYDSD
jgi:hypothetical protein